MSLILEALRKSEAQRRLGRPPDLMSELPLAAGARRRAMPAWPWFLAGLVLVAATAWWLGRQQGPGERAREVAAETAVTAEPAPAPAKPEPAPAEAATATTTADTSTRPAVVPAEKAREAASAPAPTAETATAATATTPVAEAPEGPASAAELERLRARLEATAAAASRTPAADVASGPDPEAGAAFGTPAPPAPTALPRFETLAAGDRGGLDALKFNLHVYSEDPAGRFVVVDGRRLAEGDAISARVRLVEIRRDGAVIEIDGRPVLVGRP